MGRRKNNSYVDVIRTACIEAGTYKPQFEAVISTLAEILDKREQAEKQYQEEFRGQPVISHTNSHGETNAAKNPAFQIWHDLTITALSYWRELGLTPKGLKAINDTALKSGGNSGIDNLSKVLNQLE